MYKKLKRSLVALLCLLSAPAANAQFFSLSTNILDWAGLGTVNMQAGVSLSRHLSIHAGARYNPWSFGSVESGDAMQNRARTASLEMRWWPWNVYSSWWGGARLQVSEYNRGIQAELFGRSWPTEEGLAAGLGLAAGYSRMLTSHLNLDIGIGLWAGRARYTQYRCPRCGRILSDRETGRPLKDNMKWFILPSNATQVALIYVF